MPNGKMLRVYVYHVPLLETSCFECPLKRSSSINVKKRERGEQRCNFGPSKLRVVDYKILLEP